MPARALTTRKAWQYNRELHNKRGIAASLLRLAHLLFVAQGDQTALRSPLDEGLGGGEELSNKFLLHRNCHDERDARHVNGICVKDPIIEEPDAGKLACPVLKQSGGGDPHYTGCTPRNDDVPLHLAALPSRACAQNAQLALLDAFRSDDENCVTDAQAHQKMAAYCSFGCLLPICLRCP
jgi:hypothetical protein